MPDLTTAQRLAAYRDELRDCGFDDAQIIEYLRTAATVLAEDIQVQADLDEDPSIGEVRVRLKPELNEDDLERVAERVHETARQAAQR